MHRLVFFGMNGAYSSLTLSALLAAGLRPVLVVLGVERKKTDLFPVLEVQAATQGTWIGKMLRRGPGGTPQPVLPDTTQLLELARAAGIDALTTSDANQPKARAKIAAVQPSAFFIAGFPHLLSAETLALAPRGGLNLHPGKLPEERGPAPLFWALREGRTQIDWTVHVLDTGEDSGDIVATGPLSYAPGTEGEQILAQCARAAAREVVRALRSLLDGDLLRHPQPKGQYRRRRRPEFRDGRLDTALSAEQVYTFAAGCARAYSLFAEVAGDRFFVSQAVSYDLEARLGYDYVLTGDRLLLRCNPGLVELVLKEQGAIFSAEYQEHLDGA